MKYTILEALKEIGRTFQNFNLDNLVGIKYEDGSKNKFILEFPDLTYFVNLDYGTYHIIK